MFLSSSDTEVLKKSCLIYLLYALFHTQCLLPRVKIRVTTEAFEQLLHFTEQMSVKEHLDLVFVFSRLRMEKAFMFVATITTVS